MGREDAYKAKVPIAAILSVPNMRKSLYPRLVTIWGVTFERTKLKSHWEAEAVARP